MLQWGGGGGLTWRGEGSQGAKPRVCAGGERRGGGGGMIDASENVKMHALPIQREG